MTQSATLHSRTRIQSLTTGQSNRRGQLIPACDNLGLGLPRPDLERMSPDDVRNLLVERLIGAQGLTKKFLVRQPDKKLIELADEVAASNAMSA